MDLPFETGEGGGGEGGTLASTVLVVDDEPVVLDICARLLERESDLVVLVAASAEDALPILREQRVDVLVTDKNLPGMGGVELVAEARNLQPTMEALMITAYASSESVIAAFAAGASDYILKPFDDLRVLRAKVRAALERRTSGTQVREQAREQAREAAALLAAGQDAPEPAHVALEVELRAYEESSRTVLEGKVAVVGSEDALRALREAGFEVREVAPYAPELETVDVVVVETGDPQWRTLAERLQRRPPDVLLLASPQADLGDLLEAITLRMDLVGFGSTQGASALPEKVRMLLLRRGVQRAQDRLAAALSVFRRSIPTPSA
ncbi:response regulator [Myxococcus sp. CA051A]|nr:MULTISPECIES: response regulator [Myxococcus]NTX04032.1 response regulator [Myxococcus sp. CA040A]NTX13356.1 response regulator [Myxococcus sp. CA056]NTX35784.1 response regulator [Myxococcus sp. CA033]NTX61816.1 response regulator [Myxococcus sp. CA051A]